MMVYKTPKNLGWLDCKLEQRHIDFLWERIKEGGENHKKTLAGNISKSFKIKDKDDYFYKEVLTDCMNGYYDQAGTVPIRQLSSYIMKLKLTDFWCNYQYKHEFNPYHHHGGVYSFAIWLKIPYNWREQNNLEHLRDVKDDEKKAGIFEFEFTDILGGICHYGYRLDKSMEGQMVFFPAALKHCVYPFYGTDEPRVSISGNLTLEPEIK